ncbi:MAG: dicarboxylate/amino acid:cation symporter [Lachnospiraceae bacterium]|nr:dicarboxylate/amino acid:cation symporter [Lachnospiraceae bacterium]
MGQRESVLYKADPKQIVEILDDIGSRLRTLGVSEKDIERTRFETEDILAELIDCSFDDSTIRVTVRKSLNNVSVRLSCKGRESDYQENRRDLFQGDIDEEAESIIRSNLLKEYQRNIRMSRRGSINTVTVTVTRRKKNSIMISAAALLLGVLCGALMKTVLPEDLASFCADSVFGTGTSLFLRAIKMMISLLVFFSIASSLSGFKDLKELGKAFGRVISMFSFTSVLTIVVTYAITLIIPIGNESLKAAANSSMKYDTMNGASSVSDIFLNIIPDSLLKAFMDTNMLQILFAAILTGIAVTMMGKNSGKVSEALSIMDELFRKVVLIIVKFMPVCIFCSMASMVIKIDAKEFNQVAGWMGQVYFCDLVVILMLLVLVMLLGRTSPVWFLKQISQIMVSGFAVASSNAVMPMTMQTCKEKLKISPEIYSFSIPLGIVINMDGGCVTMIVSTFFLARVYGISIPPHMLLPFFISVFMLSVAAPAVPGGILLCLTVLLPQVGIPIEGISIIIGLYFMVAMVQTMTNITSTVACSYIADRMEKRHS